MSIIRFFKRIFDKYLVHHKQSQFMPNIIGLNFVNCSTKTIKSETMNCVS